MRKNILSLSIAAMCGGLGLPRSTVACIPYADFPQDDGMVRVTPEGIGHILQVPHYTSRSNDVYDVALHFAPSDVFGDFNLFLKGS